VTQGLQFHRLVEYDKNDSDEDEDEFEERPVD